MNELVEKDGRRCGKCTILLTDEISERTVCRCGKYHSAPSTTDPRYCRPCAGQPVLTGRAQGEDSEVEQEETNDDEE